MKKKTPRRPFREILQSIEYLLFCVRFKPGNPIQEYFAYVKNKDWVSKE